MYGYIYKTTNLLNGMIYIGQKKSSKKLEYYLGSGKHLKRAINVYGKENFKCEIIEEINCVEDLDSREIYWIKYYDATNPKVGYNISDGGLTNRTFSGENNPMYGKHHTECTKNKIAQAQINYNINHSNNATKQEVKDKISNSLSGHCVTEETKSKISESLKTSNWITDGQNTVNVSKDYLDEFIERGFWIIKQPSTKTKRDNSQKRKRVWVQYKNLTKVIDEKYLNNYIECGFIKIKKPRRNKTI